MVNKWSIEDIETLKIYWPHFGTVYLSSMLGISTKRIKSKVNKLRLTLLPKHERLCSICRTKFQSKRHYGIHCRECHLVVRKKARRIESTLQDEKIRLERWIRRAANTLKYRNSTDITYEYLVELWYKQDGKCFYSNLQMITPIYGSGRSIFSPSVDRIDSSKGYTRDNIVWATWACNVGKHTMDKQQYIEVCKAVVNHVGDNNYGQ